MHTIRWLHITDIHIGQPNNHFYDDVKTKFFDDLKRLLSPDFPIDLVLITGDLVYSGKKTQFDNLNSFLQDL